MDVLRIGDDYAQLTSVDAPPKLSIQSVFCLAVKNSSRIVGVLETRIWPCAPPYRSTLPYIKYCAPIHLIALVSNRLAPRGALVAPWVQPTVGTNWAPWCVNGAAVAAPE